MGISPGLDFYVYAWFRATGEPFYIGKGRKHRWRPSGCRSNRFRQIVKQAKAAGQELPVVILRTGLTNEEACAIERAFIAAIGREPNGPLINETAGGDGMSGFRLSEETRKKISAARSGRHMSDETKAKISASLKGKPKPLGFGERQSVRQLGVRHPERGSKISASKKGKCLTAEALASRIEVMNRDDVKAKLRAAQLGKKASAATRAKMSATRIGKKLPPRSAEARARYRASKLDKSLSAAHRAAISAGLIAYYSQGRG